MQDSLTTVDLDSTSTDSLDDTEILTSDDSLYSGNTDVSESEISESVFYETPVSESDVETPVSENDVDDNSQDGVKTIDVDGEFAGDLKNAIAAANNGDVVQLGNSVYYTDGITLDKDITIDGQGGSVIDGGGTSGSIIELTPGASGATIQNVEITNGNNGISGDGASNLTLQNLNIHNVGLNQTIRSGSNNTGISLGHVDGLQLTDSDIYDIGRKGVGIGDTNGGTISGLTVQNVNLDAQHSQSHDAAGVKLYNTHDVEIKDNYFSNINANNIWNDTSSGTTISGNTVENVGSDFSEPGFDSNVDISGIYNEKSPDSIVENNNITSVDDFAAFNATSFTSETLSLGENNFSTLEIDTVDYWANEQAEKTIATTEDPDEANFNLFSADYFEQANIG